MATFKVGRDQTASSLTATATLADATIFGHRIPDAEEPRLDAQNVEEPGGGALAANVLSLAAVRATLEHVLTDTP